MESENPLDQTNEDKIIRSTEDSSAWFMDIKCPECFRIQLAYTLSQSVVKCPEYFLVNMKM